ncbi:MAG TPA: acylphosphatase [Acidobacteriota bacterium]|jgi:acylphosphatase
MSVDVVGYKMIVSGRVQGVGYRAFALRSAVELGLVGFARNLPDRTVEVYAEGPRSALEGLRSRLQQGPRWAAVDRITVQEQAAGSRHRSFTIEL